MAGWLQRRHGELVLLRDLLHLSLLLLGVSHLILDLLKLELEALLPVGFTSCRSNALVPYDSFSRRGEFMANFLLDNLFN